MIRIRIHSSPDNRKKSCQHMDFLKADFEQTKVLRIVIFSAPTIFI